MVVPAFTHKILVARVQLHNWNYAVRLGFVLSWAIVGANPAVGGPDSVSDPQLYAALLRRSATYLSAETWRIVQNHNRISAVFQDVFEEPLL